MSGQLAAGGGLRSPPAAPLARTIRPGGAVYGLGDVLSGVRVPAVARVLCGWVAPCTGWVAFFGGFYYPGRRRFPFRAGAVVCVAGRGRPSVSPRLPARMPPRLPARARRPPVARRPARRRRRGRLRAWHLSRARRLSSSARGRPRRLPTHRPLFLCRRRWGRRARGVVGRLAPAVAPWGLLARRPGARSRRGTGGNFTADDTGHVVRSVATQRT